MPGWGSPVTATDFNRREGPRTVEEVTHAIGRLAILGGDGPIGTPTDRNGTVPW